jgi:hypothetical protein
MKGGGMGPIFMKSREVCEVLSISRWKLWDMEKAGALTRVHLRFKRRGKTEVPADHGLFKRVDVEKLVGS